VISKSYLTTEKINEFVIHLRNWLNINQICHFIYNTHFKGFLLVCLHLPYFRVLTCLKFILSDFSTRLLFWQADGQRQTPMQTENQVERPPKYEPFEDRPSRTDCSKACYHHQVYDRLEEQSPVC